MSRGTLCGDRDQSRCDQVMVLMSPWFAQCQHKGPHGREAGGSELAAGDVIIGVRPDVLGEKGPRAEECRGP